MELICTDQNGNRPVNDREAEALEYTFGVGVGSFLIDTIKVKYDPAILPEKRGGRVISNTQILLQSNYNSEGLNWLGGFIHEAAHIWQRNTGRHRGGKGGENYTYGYNQLLSLELEREEHAEAVEHWFYVNYGIEYGLIGAGANRLTFGEIRNFILGVMGVDPGYQSEVKMGIADLLRFVKKYYARLIEEIRNPELLLPMAPGLGQNFPNPV